MTYFSFNLFASYLDSKTLDLVTHGPNLASQLARIVAGDAGRNDGTADTTGTAEMHLAADVNVGDCKKFQSELGFLSMGCD
jgi:hypothetical protein